MASSFSPSVGPPAATAIREALRAKVATDPNVVLVDELGICQGAARLDLAVVGRFLRGYEIKSDRDSLRRLAGQVGLYGRVVEEMMLITGPAHLQAATAVVPTWWGIQLVRPVGGTLRFVKVRNCRWNASIDARAAVQLLWRDEALAACRTLGVDAGLTGKPRKVIWDRLVQEAGDAKQLLAIVRERLRERIAWPAREGTLAHGFML